MLKLYDTNNASSEDSDLFHKLISKTYQTVIQNTQVWFVLLWTKYQWQWGETIQCVCTKSRLLPMSSSDFTFFFFRFAYHKNNIIVLYSYVTILKQPVGYDPDICRITAPEQQTSPHKQCHEFSVIRNPQPDLCCKKDRWRWQFEA